MSMQLTRRQFLKCCAAGAATIPLMQMAAPLQAAGKPALNERLLQAAAPAANTSLPSNLPLNLPLADIAMGWDGTLWGIDTNGAPQRYDQVAQDWSVYGSEFSAVTYVSKWRGQTSGGNYKFDTPLVVRGTDVWFDYAGPVASIGQTWSNLPDTFTLGLDGAAEAAGVLYLFRHGRFVAIDDATGSAGAPVALNTFANWPATAKWNQGSFDAIGSNVDDPSYTKVHIWHNLEYIVVDMVAQAVVDGPHPLNYYVTDAMLNVMQNGFSAVTFSAVQFNVTAYQGMVVYQATEQNGGIAIQYPAFNGGIWTPNLVHAPSGVTGALWGVLQLSSGQPIPYGVPISHDGSGWQGALTSSQLFTHISAGSDGTVFGVVMTGTNAYALAQLQADGSTWSSLTGLPVPPAHLSAGDANHVWLLGTDNKVYRYAAGSFAQVASIDMATHIAANPDGTVWHAKGDPYAYRFISEGTAAATQLEIAGGNTISRVASAGFATAFVLADNTTLQAAATDATDATTATTALYAYDSIYVWKTSQTYIPMWDSQFACYGLVPAGSNVYLVAHDPNFAGGNSFLVALDAQTGLEVWPNRFVIPNSMGYVFAGIVYDATFNFLYFAFANTVYAVDAATGLLAWQYTGAATDVYTIPNVCNGTLIFGNQGAGGTNLYQIDTLGAANAAKQGQPVTLNWTQALPGATNGIPCYIGQPAASDGSNAIYVVYRSAGTGSTAYYVTAVNGSDGSIRWTSAVEGEPFSGTLTALDCAAGQAQLPAAAAPQAVLFVNAGSAIHALNTLDGTTLQVYTLPTGRITSSGISLYSNQLYVGDTAGTLYVIDGMTMTLVTNTTDAVQNTWLGVLGKPTVIHSEDPSDTTVGVYFARGDDNLWLFDPSSGNLEQISTDLTASIITGYDPVHGMLYSAGWNGGTGPLGQVFAMRPDQALQAERSFIIESELMQDFASDAEVAGNGVARYQTHITVVDGSNAPLANTAIKIWSADEETEILVDGAAFTVGGAMPASFTLDATGSCTLVSVAGDLFSPTFTVWAPFMDSSECIVIQPDAAFHQRLAGVTASGSTDPAQTDPQQVDLSNAAGYDGTPLFSTSSDDQATASQAAPAIGQAMTAAGFGPSTASATGVNAALPKYSAYANLPAMRYSATNGQSTAASPGPVSPIGVGMTASGIAVMTPAAASALIDAMEGQEDVSIALLGSVASKIKAAWNKIKAAAAKVVQVVVSVAKDIAVGIQYIVDGVVNVVKAVAQDIEDVMISIGAFFVQLGKDIAKTVEALSLLLHLDEVIKTAALLNTQINAAFADITNVLNAAQGTVDSWFNGVGDKITGDFCDLYSSLGLPTPSNCSTASGGFASATSAASTTPFNTYNSVGSTSNTLFNTGNTSGKSQSVPCGWSSHTLRKNLGSASTPTGAVGAGAVQADPFLDLLTSFGASLQNNAALSAALQATGNAFKSTFKVNSVAEFMQMALEDLLATIQVAALAGVAVVQALLDAIFGAVATVVDGLQDLGNLDIPILSALWQKLTGNDLTFLDVICFVMAFPVTLLYRAKAGSYPSQAVSAAGSSPQATLNLLGLFSSIAQFVLGIVTAFMDFLGAAGASIPFPAASAGWKIAAILALGTLAANNVFKADLTPNTYPLLSAAFSLALPVYLALNLVAALPPEVVSFCGLGINALLTYVYVETFVHTSNQTTQVKLTLSRSVVASFTGIINPVKLAGLPVGLITPPCDLVCRVAAGVITAVQTYDTWEADLGEESPQLPFKNYSFLPIVGR